MEMEGYELIIWAGETGEDCEFVDAGKSMPVVIKKFAEALKDFPDRDISVIKYSAYGNKNEIKRYDHKKGTWDFNGEGCS